MRVRIRCMAALSALCFLLLSSMAAADTRMLRFPDVHDDRVVFSYGGDLWTASIEGGNAQRLTSHPGKELFPKFSPDGQWIAFTGQYGGDEQVYVMPVSGGEPTQLTFYPATGPLPARWGYDNQVYGWSPDGERVLFRSQREAWGSSTATLFTVARQGGLPEALPMPVSGAGVFNEDGNKLFYSPLFRDFRTWKRYQGGWAQSLWLFDLEAKDARQITDHPRTDRDPMWINGQGYFVSDRDGTLNLYRVDPESLAVEQLTEHDRDVRWASADREGQIVYELEGQLQLFDVRDGSQRALNITVPDDGINRRVRQVNVADQVNAARLSPTGQRVLFNARGNLFNAPVEDGITRRVTDRSTAHDREAAWSPDGKTIFFISDQSGEEELYAVAADGSDEPRALTSGNETRFYSPRVSPTGEHVALADKDGNILVIASDGRGGLKQAGQDMGWRNRDYSWSPAGDYLAFSLTQDSGLRALYLYSVADDQTRQISDGMFSEYRPAFSPDGKFLYFLGDREFAPQISGREWNFATNRSTSILAFALRRDADNPFAPRDAEEKGILDNGDNDNNADEDKPENTRIDWEGLAQRVIRVPVDSANYASLAVTEDALLYVQTSPFYYGRSGETQPTLQRFSFEDREAKAFAEGWMAADISADGKRVLMRRGNNWQVFDVASGGNNGKAVATAGLYSTVDPVAEWHTAFDEVWRRFRDHFYVENMHGYDWQALGEQYRALIEHVAHRSDLNYLMGEMIAELNVSHAYVSGGDEGLPERPSVSLLGARFAVDDSANRYRIARILEGQNDEPRYRSPLTEAGVDAREGDYLLAINGRALYADDNIYQRLTLPSGEALVLTLSERSDGRDARSVTVTPISDETSLHYLGWVLENHRRVTEATDGRVGYLHVPDMGANGIREFIKWFYGQIRKDGLVIDVRSNGGGNVSQMLIERLSRRPMSLGYSRTMPEASTYPNQAFNGHLVAVLDQNSASDGDIFPWQFRNAGLGPLIGMKSWGGVVGITNHGPLIDGGTVNVPEFGFADIEGNYVIEGEGVEPDIEVANDPASVIAGGDPQLERAIEEVMKKIEADPPRFPDLPEPPVKLD